MKNEFEIPLFCRVSSTFFFRHGNVGFPTFNLTISVSVTRRRRGIIYCCVCWPPGKKVNIVSNGHGRTQKCNFSVFEQKYPFQAKLAQKIKILSLSSSLVHMLI